MAKALNIRGPAGLDPRLTEHSRFGPIPRIGADGSLPSKVYARPVEVTDGEANSPRVALMVGGLGLSPSATEAAISTLPGPITLGFAPYGGDLSRQAARARQSGHEIVLQIPMEPFGLPRDNPGPHTLLAAAGKAANIENLTWLMSRFGGYAGVANFLGGKFTADEHALSPVLREIASRGLYYLDDGTSSQSLAMKLAAKEGLAAAHADVVLDSVAQPDAIEAALMQLEAIARDKGVAIGIASAFPASIAGIRRFASESEARGIALIPLSAAIASRQLGLADASAARKAP